MSVQISDFVYPHRVLISP